MGCFVREAQQRCDSREFSEWIAYYKTYGPPGDERIEMYLARITQLLANVWRAKGKPAQQLADFLLFGEAAKPKEQTGEQMAGIAHAFAAMCGTVIKAA